MKNLILIIFLSTITLGCSNSDEQNLQSNKTIIFGEVYGNCAGDCRNLYLLTEQEIFKDSNKDTEFGNWENTTFENQALPMNNFELANSLLEIPNGLLDYKGEIGNQTLADFDYFIQLKVNGKSKTWIFDEAKENTNSEIEQYIENLIQINTLLGN
ncbi:hypothetical protein [Ulvibacterium marinum]|uniref:Lipoprotein n=1 Tax=Ulvibacterium marinum TaxID=2419782 RepID=A0A3B0C936_9FLAO|nr:hypothetical protein [Ulvibacterium marinum]RKN81371.1 hypothetical protein D7Z94_10590 [Ulvibacterium marinum]